MAWIVAMMTRGAFGVVAHPHLKSSFQGTDGVRIRFAGNPPELHADIYENKCTQNPTQVFAQDVLTAFRRYLAGDYDDEIMQKVISLLEQLDLTPDEITRLIDQFEQQRRYCLHACMTTENADPVRSELFARYVELSSTANDRHGHTFDSIAMRQWFADLATDVLAEIERHV